MALATRTVTVDGIGSVPVSYSEEGSGRPVLLLHGGAGPFSVAGFGKRLAEHARVIIPVHPGFDGTPRPAQLAGIPALANVYGQLLRDLGASDACVIGNSVGGWIAAELAVAEAGRSASPVSSVVLVDAAGLQLADAPVPDVSRLSPDQITDLSYFSPDKFRVDPAAITDEQRAARAANIAALLSYAGPEMADPTLLSRLPGVSIPALVVWGAADRMIPVEHGRAYAAAIPGAQFVLIGTAGHLPQLETPAELAASVTEFALGGPRVPISEPEAGDAALAGPS